MQSIWQTITAPPVTIPFSLMWLCVFALELIMLPERIRLARYGGYWYMCPYDYRITQMVSGRRIWHRFASAAVAATWMWYTAMEHSPSTGNPDSSMGRVFGSYRNTVQFDCSVMTHHGTRNLRYRSGFRWSGLHSVRNNLGGRVRRAGTPRRTGSQSFVRYRRNHRNKLGGLEASPYDVELSTTPKMTPTISEKGPIGGDNEVFQDGHGRVAMIAMIAPTAACGTDNASSDGKTEITVWAWDNNLKANAKQFMKDNPDIKVTFANAGSGKDEYVALSNAIEAGSGAPDIAQIEYYAIPEYAIKGALKDLTDNGAGKFKDFYTPGTWSSVNYAGGIYGLPMDSGPMAFFYDKEVFDKAGIDEPPATWDEFYEDAKKIRAVGSYITNDPGDAGFFNAMVWQAGGHPYSTSKDGKTVTVNLTGDPGVRKFTKLWQKMIDEDLIETKTKGTSDDWYRAVGSGEFAGVITAAWAPGMFLNQASEGAGKWRIAQMPAWSAGGHEVSESGGSSLAILSSSKKADAAYKFMAYALHNKDAVMSRVDQGGFPADLESMKNDKFLNQTTMVNTKGETVEYFGGQKFNAVFAEAAKNVVTGFEFLPYDVYARSIFTDTVGAAYMGQGTLMDGVKAWQAKLVEQGRSQGFTVKEG